MSRALPKYNKRRVGTHRRRRRGGAVRRVIAGSALAGETSKNGSAARRPTRPPGTVYCPDVDAQLPAIPASAQAEVDRNLAQLDTQIAEANKRLVDTVGQGGPDFVQNAILGPLEDKRVADLNRIATAIGRTAAKPAGLDALAACGSNGGAAAARQPEDRAAAASTPGEAGARRAPETRGAISCADVACSCLRSASAQAEVDTATSAPAEHADRPQANKRLVDTVGQGGARLRSRTRSLARSRTSACLTINAHRPWRIGRDVLPSHVGRRRATPPAASTAPRLHGAAGPSRVGNNGRGEHGQRL